MPTSLPVSIASEAVTQPTPLNPLLLFIAAWAIALLFFGALENFSALPGAMDQILLVVSSG